MQPIEAVQEWFAACCDGEWEHTYGVTIGTLDNPGWAVDIDLTGTHLEGKPFDAIRLQRTDDDWVNCEVTSGKFKGRGGPRNLAEILVAFGEWAA